jgi:hypothetical protein
MKTSFGPSEFLWGAILLVATLLGCKAGPAPDSGFLESPERMAREARLPFQRVWYDPAVAFERYTEVMIAPVNMEYLMKMDWWKEVTFPGDRRAGGRELGLYLQSRVFDAFEGDPNKRLKPMAFASGEPGPQTLILEMAIVELVPTQPVLNMLGGPTRLGKGTVAIEGRFRDGLSDNVVAMFADRETAKRSVVNVADLTWYSHARKIVDEWAQQLVAITNAGEGERVKDSSSFTLLPW